MRKADNFDPSKWLVENKITTQSRLNEAKDPDSVVSQEARDMFYNAVAKVMKDLYQADIMDNDIIDDYLGTEGGLLGDAIEAFLHPEDLDESRLNENENPVMLGVGDQITPDMLKNPSKFDFPMKIVSFSNDGSGDTVRVKRILKKKGMFGGEKEVEDTFEDLVDNWEKIHLKPTVKMSSQTEIDF